MLVKSTFFADFWGNARVLEKTLLLFLIVFAFEIVDSDVAV